MDKPALDLHLFNQRIIMRALIHLVYNCSKPNNATVAKLYGQIDKINAIIGPEPKFPGSGPQNGNGSHSRDLADFG